MTRNPFFDHTRSNKPSWNATPLERLAAKGTRTLMSGSTLLNGLVDKSAMIIPAHNIKIQQPKSSNISTPKATKMSDEQKVEIHPFILEHRSGTTERVTSMDPMSKEFIQSLRIPYQGAYRTKALTSHQDVPFDLGIGAIINNQKSKLFSTVAPQVLNLGGQSLQGLGKPWDENGWINAPFLISTGYIQHRKGRSDGFDESHVLMETWKYREPDFSTQTTLAETPVKATLVNKFEAIESKLICYSFIVKYGYNSYDKLSGTQALIHLWVNKTYFNHGRRFTPMYFEDAGSFTFIVNAVLGCMGLEMDASGELTLTVFTKSGPRVNTLQRSHIQHLITLGACIDFSKITENLKVDWTLMTNVDWQGVGYDLQPGGQTWSLSSDVSKLPWSVQNQRSPSAISIKRSIGQVGGSAAGAREIFELDSTNRKRAISKSIGQIFWNKIRNDYSITTFDSILKLIRTEYISSELIEELRRLNPDITAAELLAAIENRSDEVGRFVFERNLVSSS